MISVGDRCLFGKGSGIVGHLEIVIGDDVWTGHHVYITDQNHGYDDLDLPISRQVMPERPVSIGSGSWLGHGTVVLPGATIGRHVVIGANSVVTGDDPRQLRGRRRARPRRSSSCPDRDRAVSERPPSGVRSSQRSVGASEDRAAGRGAARHLVVAGERLDALGDRHRCRRRSR